MSTIRRKKTDEKKLKEKLWELCKQITRKRYQNSNGTWNCYTCDRLIDEPSKAQTGHFIPSGTCGAFLRFDLRNLRIQDYYCNINLGGNGTEYYRRMVEEVGQEAVDQLFRDKNKIVKAGKHFYQTLIDKYTKNMDEVQVVVPQEPEEVEVVDEEEQETI